MSSSTMWLTVVLQVAELEVEWVEPVVVASPLVFEATKAELLAKMAASMA